MIRRPRSVALPMLFTVLTLVGLTFRVARFDEHFTITITKPAATDPPRTLYPGQVIDVEGFIDAGEGVYTAVNLLYVRLIHKDPTAPERRICYGADGYFGTHDPASNRFSAYVRVVYTGPEPILFLDINVIDKVGRIHGSGHDRVPMVNEVPIHIAPTVPRR